MCFFMRIFNMINKSIKVEKIVPKFKLLKPVKTDPCKDNIRLYNRALTIEQMEKYILGPASKDLVAVDIETRGLSPFYPHTYKSETYSPCIVGIGLAYPTKRSYKAAYFDPRMQNDETMRYFYKRLSEMYLIAHNAMFDGLWLRHAALELGVKERLNWVADTYGLYKHLAGADYIGQTHGLKQAQVELLGWDESNDIEQKKWLIENGFIKGNLPKELKEKLGL